MDCAPGEPKSLIETLKEQIRSRVLEEGCPLPSEADLADTYELTRHQVREALRELQIEGYIDRSQGRRSIVADISDRFRILPMDGARTIALSFPAQDSDYIRDIVMGSMRVLTRSGYQSIVYALELEKEREFNFLRRLRSTTLSGLILWLGTDCEESHELLQSLTDATFPVVLVDHAISGVELDAVVSDNRAIGLSLTQALISRGHRRLGFIMDPSHFTSAHDRYAGYREALEATGNVEGADCCQEVNIHNGSAPASVDRLMARRQPPEALVCANEDLALRVAKELERLDYETPHHIEIATLRDNNAVSLDGIPVATASQQGEKIGAEAAELLVARIDDPRRPTELRVVGPVFPRTHGETSACAHGKEVQSVEMGERRTTMTSET